MLCQLAGAAPGLTRARLGKAMWILAAQRSPVAVVAAANPTVREQAAGEALSGRRSAEPHRRKGRTPCHRNRQHRNSDKWPCSGLHPSTNAKPYRAQTTRRHRAVVPPPVDPPEADGSARTTVIRALSAPNVRCWNANSCPRPRVWARSSLSSRGMRGRRRRRRATPRRRGRSERCSSTRHSQRP